MCHACSLSCTLSLQDLLSCPDALAWHRGIVWDGEGTSCSRTGCASQGAYGVAPEGQVLRIKESLLKLMKAPAATRPCAGPNGHATKGAHGLSGVLRHSQPGLSALTSLLAAGMVIVSLLVAAWLFSAQLERTQREIQGQRIAALAQRIARLPEVRSALSEASSPQAAPPVADSRLAARIERLRQENAVDFIVVMRPDGLRLSHPDPTRIGQPFQGGDEQRALAGASYLSESRGTLGESLRSFVPVMATASKGGERAVVGAVAIGITLDSLGRRLADEKRQLLLGLGVLMLFGTLGALGLARYLRRQLKGLEPAAIARLVEEHQAVLASLEEGIIVVDSEGRITLVNAAARELLGALPTLGERLDDWLPDTGMRECLVARQPESEQEEARLRQVTHGGRRLLVRCQRVHDGELLMGGVLVLREHDRMQRLAEELTGVRRQAESLRAARHELRNRLHVLSGLTQMQDLAGLRDYLALLVERELPADAAAAERIADPLLAGLLIGKHSEARERGITLNVELEIECSNGRHEEGMSPEEAAPVEFPVLERSLSHDLVSVIGNLLDNAFEALEEMSEDGHVPSVTLGLMLESLAAEAQLSISVADNGPGMPTELRQMAREAGVSSHGEGRGLGLSLVQDIVAAREGEWHLYAPSGGGTLVELILPCQRLDDAAP
ncbi:sensor histidine kinase [bacterium Scap17]|nr:sensor histidine kinase [bacterium Scap17]